MLGETRREERGERRERGGLESSHLAVRRCCGYEYMNTAVLFIRIGPVSSTAVGPNTAVYTGVINWGSTAVAATINTGTCSIPILQLYLLVATCRYLFEY